jgi:hypothetical protein
VIFGIEEEENSGIQEEKSIARGSRGLARIEEDSGILEFWDSEGEHDR